MGAVAGRCTTTDKDPIMPTEKTPRKRKSTAVSSNKRAVRAKPVSAPPLKSKKMSMPAGAGDQRLSMIAEAAYFRAEQRGFARGFELEDWLQAETEIDSWLAHQSTLLKPKRRSGNGMRGG
jgi:hypothetical protein